MTYQHGRALLAKGDATGARHDFEAALAAGYPSAGVDLASMLSTSDPAQAGKLLEIAWGKGIPIAAFSLGALYENSPAPDQARAWSWYQKAADAGEPNALARFGRRAEEGSDLLQAFKFYAAAAERARNEYWPDDMWKDWRYRRAYLARLLAREGKMAGVAEQYAQVRQKYPAPFATLLTSP